MSQSDIQALKNDGKIAIVRYPSYWSDQLFANKIGVIWTDTVDTIIRDEEAKNSYQSYRAMLCAIPHLVGIYHRYLSLEVRMSRRQ